MKKITKRILLSALGCIMIASVSSCSSENEYVYGESIPHFEMNNSISAVVDKVENACIGVTASSTSSQYYSSGSGVVVKQDGNTYYAITNYHVVEGYDNYRAYISKNFSIKAQLVATYPGHDLACIKFEAADKYNITSINLPDEDDEEKPVLNVGQTVVAIGCPLGIENFNYTTTGTISTPVYTSVIEANNTYTNVKVFGHDAAINSGNSGGALFDLNANLIGINFRKTVSDSEGNMVEGMGESIYYTEVIDFLQEYNVL